MKKTIFYVAVSAFVFFAFAACTPEKEFNVEFLYGKWHTTTYPDFAGHDFYEVYNRNGTGSSWDQTEGGLPQAFEWTLSGERLTRKECMETGCETLVIDYTMNELTPDKLVYTDRFGNKYSWTKAD